MIRERVEFPSGGAMCVGYLYRPPGELPAPCVVMGHGFGGTQEGSLAANARDFAASGFVVLSFDYRGFGESGGEPRQVVDIRLQLADWRAAIACARARPEVRADRVALWGSSLAGGHVVAVAAADPALAAVVSQVPFNGFPRKVEGRTPRETRALLKVIAADWLAGRQGRPPVYIKAVGEPGELAVMASAEAKATVSLMDNPTWENRVAPRGVLEMALCYRPSRSAKRCAMPVLVCIAEMDRETPPELTRALALRAPRGELRAYPCSHFQFYSEAVRPTVLADQVNFLKTHLFGFPGL